MNSKAAELMNTVTEAKKSIAQMAKLLDSTIACKNETISALTLQNDNLRAENERLANDLQDKPIHRTESMMSVDTQGELCESEKSRLRTEVADLIAKQSIITKRYEGEMNEARRRITELKQEVKTRDVMINARGTATGPAHSEAEIAARISRQYETRINELVGMNQFSKARWHNERDALYSRIDELEGLLREDRLIRPGTAEDHEAVRPTINETTASTMDRRTLDLTRGLEAAKKEVSMLTDELRQARIVHASAMNRRDMEIDRLTSQLQVERDEKIMMGAMNMAQSVTTAPSTVSGVGDDSLEGCSTPACAAIVRNLRETVASERASHMVVVGRLRDRVDSLTRIVEAHRRLEAVPGPSLAPGAPLAELNAERARHIASVQRMAGQIDQLNGELDDLRAELAAVRMVRPVDMAECEKEVAALKKTVIALTGQLNDTRTKAAAVEARLTAEADALAVKLEGTEGSTDERVTGLSMRLKGVEAERDTLHEEVTGYVRQLAIQHGERRAAQVTLQKAQERWDAERAALLDGM